MSQTLPESRSMVRKVADSRLFAGLIGLAIGFFLDNLVLGLLLLCAAAAVYYYFSRKREDVEMEEAG